MRLKVKKEVLTLLNTLKEADSKISVLMQYGRLETLAQLIEACQNVAISACTVIEKAVGQNTKAVFILEKYCEEVNLIYQNDRVDIIKLDRMILEAEEAIKALPITYEIVFLPYKASMWDCMESVWKTAKEMQNCSCHVVPIPYYDRNADGELTTFHFEGQALPQDISIENWKTFPIQQLHPDIIFIHNPYDQMNYATSIHPNFYSESLKKMTECLVLLPYAVSSKEHVAEAFSVLPGILYANNIFVQSGTLCREHIEWFHKWEEEYQCKGIFGEAEEKFQVCGSPKFDKAWSAKREDYLYTEEWLRKVQRPDGGRKIAFLLNTSMNQLLHCEEIYLRKLKQVLEMFRGNSEVLLVWRPHPLMEQTIRAMRPELLESYKSIVHQFQKEDWGIYDESADMYQSITFTDVYYGDWSSVATLYQCTGKPVILENYKAFQLGRLEYKIPLHAQQFSISDFCICGSDMYLYDGVGDVIYQSDITSGKAKVIAMLPHGKPGTSGYIHMELVGDYLVMVPLRETDVVFYHLQTGQLIRFSKREEESFRFCYVDGHEIFFTPLLSQNIDWIDLEKGTPRWMQRKIDSNMECKLESEESFKSNGLPLALNGKIFIPFQFPHGVAEFDCDIKKVVKYHDLPDCATMTFDGVKYWWCDKHGQLYCWNYECGTSILVHDFKTDLEHEPEGLLVYFLAYAKGYLYLLPHQYHPDMENKAFRVHTETFEILEICELRVQADRRLKPNRNLRCYCGIRMDEQMKLYTYCNPRNTIVCIEPENCEIHEISMRLDSGYLTDNKRHGYIQESQSLLPEYFLECWGNDVGPVFEREKVRSLLEAGAWKQIMLRNAQNGEQDIGLEYLDGKCGERIMRYLIQQFEEADR